MSRGFLALNYEDVLAPGGFAGQFGENRGNWPSHDLLEFLRELTGHNDVAFPEDRLDLGKGFENAVGRLVKDDRPWLRTESFQFRLPPFFHGEEPFEDKSVGWQAADDQRRNECRRTRNRHDR